jgi:hypothetical protein
VTSGPVPPQSYDPHLACYLAGEPLNHCHSSLVLCVRVITLLQSSCINAQPMAATGLVLLTRPPQPAPHPYTVQLCMSSRAIPGPASIRRTTSDKMPHGCDCPCSDDRRCYLMHSQCTDSAHCASSTKPQYVYDSTVSPQSPAMAGQCTRFYQL